MNTQPSQTHPAFAVRRPRRKGPLIATVVIVALLAAGAVVGGDYLYGRTATTPTVSSDEEEIRAVVDRYATETDFAAVKSVLCASLVDHLLADHTEAQASAVYRSDERLYGTSTVESYENIEISYTRARATIIADLAGGSVVPALSDMRLTIGLVEENGRWKACTELEPDEATTDRIQNEVDKANAADAIRSFFDLIAAADLTGVRNSACGELAKTLANVTAESAQQLAEEVGTIDTVDETTVTGDSASVTVTLENSAGPTVAVYSLIRTGTTWRVCQEKVLV